jgi:anti-anti-sigma factor
VHTHSFGAMVCDRTIRVHGEIDMAVTDQLRETIICAAENVPQHTIVLDMAWVTFLDSTGTGALIDAHHRLEALGKTLVLHSVPESVAKILRISGVLDYLNVRSVRAESS